MKIGRKNNTGTATNVHAGSTRHGTNHRLLVSSFLDADAEKRTRLRDAPKPTKQRNKPVAQEKRMLVLRPIKILKSEILFYLLDDYRM